MQLVINTYGSYLKKKEGCSLVKNEDKEFEVSAKKVEIRKRLNILRGVLIVVTKIFAFRVRKL